MDDRLLDDEVLPLSRKSVLPGEGFFVPDSLDVEVAEREAREAVVGAETIVVADPDADGLACVALLRDVYEEAALVPTGPHEIGDALDRLAEFAEPGARAFVCDLCPDSPSDLNGLATLAERLDMRWFDHHQWDPDLARRVREAGVDLVVGDSEEECTADVLVRSLDFDFEDRHRDLAAATRDHDLWLREDPRSDDLADFAYWAEPEEYVEVVREHGSDLPLEVQEVLADRRVEKDALVDLAVGRATFEEVGPWTVGITYGRCSQNEVAEALRGQGADAAVVVKPAGAASLRGSDTFERCHRVARRVNGGGHPKAAGCKPEVYDDMLDYAHHWTTRGAVTKRVILEAFEAVAEETEGATGDGAGRSSS